MMIIKGSVRLIASLALVATSSWVWGASHYSVSEAQGEAASVTSDQAGVAQAGGAQAEEEQAPSMEGLEPLLEELIAGGASERLEVRQLDALYSWCMGKHAELRPLTEYLESAEGETEANRGRALKRIRANLLWRHGYLAEARKAFSDLADVETDLDARYNVARLLDAEGKTKEAVTAYEALLPLVQGALREQLNIRIALMQLESPASGSKPGGEDLGAGSGKEVQDPLTKFASGEGVSGDLRNRAAVVLALVDKPALAIELYRVEGEQKQKFLGELRRTEWGIAAGDSKVAQDAAWNAVQYAKVARERRYALTLLAEAYRMADELDKLLERLATDPGSLAPETRSLWIEILRETSRFDEAIALVQGGRGDSVFTDEEQLSLFGMYREADREDDLILAYQGRIQSEPRSVVWREGLSRYFLESGKREQVLGVWTDWLAEQSQGIQLVGADSLMALGLDELAIQAAEDAVTRSSQGVETNKLSNPEAALLFLFELYRDRGRLDTARETLLRLEERAAPDSPVRIQLGDAYERLGDQRKAVEVLTELVNSRPEGEAGEDVEMRLAWLRSEVGDEDEALVQWRDLWTRVNSVARRRYVEDRMMTVASRIGSLADVAVELEEKLFAGKANQRESGLLVRLYTKVGDSVSAAEVIEEFMRHSGGSEVQTLTEKARVYLACTDYYHYEKAVKRLIELDPEGEPDYLRQLAMSQLERGQPKEARDILLRLASLETGDSSSAEFEAGVLSLSGMREEAIMAYRRGLAGHPDRIDAYILMANLMKELGQTDQAVGMFQFLAETAEKDDLFTIAIDGILNMLVDADPRPKTVQWARRITLERLAGKHDKPYLYQLLSDLTSEAADHDGHLLALENALPSAGPRRGSMLRELMDLTVEKRRSFNSPGWPGDKAKHLAMGRRLIGLAEAVPPQVYLDLGTAFLKEGDDRAAERTFALTRSLPEGPQYQREAAGSFEKEGFVKRALGIYEGVLSTQPSNVPLLVKVGELHENIGDDVRAAELYRKALDLLMLRRPLSIDTVEVDESKLSYWERNRNVDDFSQNYARVLNGVLSTLDGESGMESLLSLEAAKLDEEWPLADEKAAEMEQQHASRPKKRGANKEEEWVSKLTHHPRIQRRVEFYRRVALAWGRTKMADAMDLRAVAAYPKDDDLLESVVRERLRWGQVGSAKKLIEASGRNEEEKRALLVKVGEVVESTGNTPIPVAEAAQRILPLVAEGRDAEVEAILRRADLGKVEEEEMNLLPVLFSAARYVGKEDVILKIGRDWVRLKMGGGRAYELEEMFNQIGGALSTEGELALGRYFVSRVFEDPEENAGLVTMLPTIDSRFDEALVSPEQVLEMLDGYGEKYAWGLGPVIMLLPTDSRAAALRSVWDKLEKTQRAPLLLELVTQAKGELGEDFESFILTSFEASLSDAEKYIEYTIGELIDVQGKDQLVLDLAEVLVKGGFDGVKSLGAIQAIRMHNLGLEGALDQAAKAWTLLAPETGYRDAEAIRKLGDAFLPDGLDALLAYHDAKLQEDGDSVELHLSRIKLLRIAGEEFSTQYDAALADSLEVYPEEEKVLDEAATRCFAQDRIGDGARMLERVIAVTKDTNKKKRMWKRVRGYWKRLHNPGKELGARKALAELEEGGSTSNPMMGGFVVVGGVLVPEDEVDDKPKGLPKTMKNLKQAIESDELAKGAEILRRIWRKFPVGEPKQPRYFSMYSRSSAMSRLKWPADKKEETEKPSEGGMVGFIEARAKARAEKEKEDANEDDGPTVYARLAEHDPLVQEFERFLTTQTPRQLDNLQGLLEGLLIARDRKMGPEASLNDLLERVRTGRAGKVDKILLLASLDREEGQLPESAQEVLSDLPRTVSPRDAVQIKRLARVYARGGLRDASVRLFRWCGTQAQARSYFFGFDEGGSSLSVKSLVQTIKELFEGEQRIALIENVIQFSNPGDRPWQRSQFEVLVLNTWSEVLPPKEALERSRDICEAAIDLGEGLRRDSALRAAALFAAAGEMENALRALEIGIAKLDPEGIKQPDEVWYRVDPTQPAYVSQSDIATLFPEPTDEREGASIEWLTLGGDALLEWAQAERVRVGPCAIALCWVSWRMHEAGEVEEAANLLARLDELGTISPKETHWWIDALRLTGNGELAIAKEKELLERGQLHTERLPRVVRGILDVEGPQAALAAAQVAAQNSQHEDLLVVLREAAEQAGDAEAKAHWGGVAEAAAEAREGLAALEEKEK